MFNKSVKIFAPGDAKLINTDMPQRKKNEALLKLLYGGICGSDLGSYKGTFAYFSYPRIPGHEFSAEIIEIDANDYGLEKGMIVTGNPYFNCEKCYACQTGHVNCCISNETLGCQREGAFSQYFVMPLDRIYNGKGVSAKALAVVEPFCISYHGVKRANIKKGSRVLVIGAGTIGLLAAMAAEKEGADITLCDVAQGKLDIAEKFGFKKSFLNQSSEKFLQNVSLQTDDCGYDVVIEAVGLPSTFQNCIDAAANAGTVVLIGVGKENLDFNFTMIQKKELNIYGSRNAYKEDFESTIEMIKNDGLDILKIVTNVYSFDDAPKAFEEFSQHSGEMLKVLLKF